MNMNMNMLKVDQQHEVVRYHVIQVVLHWLSALVIIWTLVSGGYILLFGAGGRGAMIITDFNVALTTLFIPLFLLRCYYRWRLPASGGLAGWVHRAMYGVTGAVLLTGVLMMTRPIDLFGWVQIPQPLYAPELLMAFNFLHKVASLLLAGLVILHVAAVVWHECNGRRILRRMWFGAD